MTGKKILAGVMAVLLLVGLTACGKDNSKGQTPTTTNTPIPIGDKEIYAEQFITAYMMRDHATRYAMYCYDARGRWEDTVTNQNGGSPEAFFAEAQKQANEKGLNYTIDTFDSYLSAYHQFILTDYINIYGTYAISATATKCEKQDAETVAKTIDGVLQAVDEAYLDVDAVKAITEAYTITVEWKVDGELKDLTEHMLVQVVLYKGEWRVASHSI